MKKETITYYYRGMIERGTGKGTYKWIAGYSANSSDGLVLYGWNTYRECQREAKSKGCTAKFVRGV